MLDYNDDTFGTNWDEIKEANPPLGEVASYWDSPQRLQDDEDQACDDDARLDKLSEAQNE